MLEKTWTRTLALALVLPLAAAACAEGGEDEIEETPTLETTTPNRVELEPFGTADIGGWITSRTEGDELVLTLNLEKRSPGPAREGEAGMETDTEDEMGAEGEMGAETGMVHPEGEMGRSARLIEGRCMDVRPGAGVATGQTATSSSPSARDEAESGQTGTDTRIADETVRTVVEFKKPEEWSSTGSARSGMEQDTDEPETRESGTPTTTRTSPMSGHTLEARVRQSRLTGQSYAVVVGGEGHGESMMRGEESELQASGESEALACADVTRLVQNAGAPSAGTRPDQPTGTPGTGTERGSGTDESGESY